jgi:hypothetical protein
MVCSLLLNGTYEDSPAVTAKGTVKPSAKPMTTSLTTAP